MLELRHVRHEMEFLRFVVEVLLHQMRCCSITLARAFSETSQLRSTDYQKVHGVGDTRPFARHPQKKLEAKTC